MVMPTENQCTEQAFRALQDSQQLLIPMKHNQWDVEHLFCGLLEVQNSLSAKILENMGVNVSSLILEVREKLEKAPKIGSQGQFYITPRMQNIFSISKQEARRLKDELIGADHLLIAIVP